MKLFVIKLLLIEMSEIRFLLMKCTCAHITADMNKKWAVRVRNEGKVLGKGRDILVGRERGGN